MVVVGFFAPTWAWVRANHKEEGQSSESSGMTHKRAGLVQAARPKERLQSLCHVRCHCDGWAGAAGLRGALHALGKRRFKHRRALCHLIHEVHGAPRKKQ